MNQRVLEGNQVKLVAKPLSQINQQLIHLVKFGHSDDDQESMLAQENVRKLGRQKSLRNGGISSLFYHFNFPKNLIISSNNPGGSNKSILSKKIFGLEPSVSSLKPWALCLDPFIVRYSLPARFLCWPDLFFELIDQKPQNTK